MIGKARQNYSYAKSLSNFRVLHIPVSIFFLLLFIYSISATCFNKYFQYFKLCIVQGMKMAFSDSFKMKLATQFLSNLIFDAPL